MTSSAHLVIHAALFDELEKIAEAQLSPGDKTKKWLKNSALVAAGAGAGAAAATVLNKYLTTHLGKAWDAADTKTKMLILAPLIGLSTVGAVVAGHKVMGAHHKAMNER